MLIDKINESKDVKQLTHKELEVLASEIRQGILNRCSNYGGHLGSNLGIVELVIALHYVYSIPDDKIIYDVSHQAFPHKMLTGRAKYFWKDYSKIIEFTNPSEDKSDIFHIGHTSTSIGLACGMARARDILGGKENIIAVIGDAALGGGQAFEGLNIATELKSQFLIVLNDNEMSVFDNHGGLYSHLSDLRNRTHVGENLFENMGFEYYYLEEGNNLQSLINVLNHVRNNKNPTVLHIHTLKGKGYLPAEINKAKWHYTKPFIINDDNSKNQVNKVIKNIENFGTVTYEYLSKTIQKDAAVMVVAASTPSSFGFTPDKVYGTDIENNFIDVGIEEQNAVLVAAGMSKRGGKVVFGTWASFFQRAYDQIAHEIVLNNLPVTFIVTNASIQGDPNDTHAGIYDIPMLSSIPNLLYLAPVYSEEYISMLDWSLNSQVCPVAIRLPWNGVHHGKQAYKHDWNNVKYSVEKKGEEVAIIALGGFFDLGIELCECLKEKYSINPTLINPHYANRTDDYLLNVLKKDHKLIVTLEDGTVYGGFGAMISQFYSLSSIMVKNYGFSKRLPIEFDAKRFMLENGLNVELMANEINEILIGNVAAISHSS